MEFHAVTGCDTTSQFSGKGKRNCWKVFLKEPDLLQAIDYLRYGTEKYTISMSQFDMHILSYFQRKKYSIILFCIFSSKSFSLHSLILSRIFAMIMS
jgi:hypothetical protein